MEDKVITTETEQDTSVQETAPEIRQETINDIVAEPKETLKETVGLDKYMQEKKTRQAFEKKVQDLEAQIAAGATREEISSDVNDIANEYNVDATFLATLTKSIESKLESKIQDKLRPITEEKERAKFEVTFNERLTNAIENMPEYEKIISPTVIKQLFLLRDENGKLVNGNISLEQLIENTYANAIGGKRTMESGKPSGRQDPAEIDYSKATKNTEYFNEIMNNPNLKAKYNSELEKRLNL